MTTSYYFDSPPLSGVTSHAHIAQDRSWYGTMNVPRSRRDDRPQGIEE